MAKGKDVYHEFPVETLQYQSLKAYLFKIEGIPEPVWVPKSQCEYDKDTSVVFISEWLVKQKDELNDRLLKGF